MRDIKFRGKHKIPYGDSWKYGYYALEDGVHMIIMPHSTNYEKELKENRPLPPISAKHIIDINTLGQYTGLKDKNGTEIYEGDIVEVDEEGRLLFGTKEHPSRKYQLVGFKDGAFMTSRNNIDSKTLDTYLWILKNYITVVGNIYDNPDLLKGVKNEI